MDSSPEVPLRAEQGRHKNLELSLGMKHNIISPPDTYLDINGIASRTMHERPDLDQDRERV
jgi:hypothetical protein